MLSGLKGVQIDAVTDGQPLPKAAADSHNVTFAYPANANHVFKMDTRQSAKVAAAPGNGYNADGTHLDPEALTRSLAGFAEWSPSCATSSPDRIGINPVALRPRVTMRERIGVQFWFGSGAMAVLTSPTSSCT